MTEGFTAGGLVSVPGLRLGGLQLGWVYKLGRIYGGVGNGWGFGLGPRFESGGFYGWGEFTAGRGLRREGV